MAVISIVNTAHFDFGALNQLEKSLERLGVTRPMLVTDKGLVAAGAAAKVLTAAGARPIVATYDETLSNPDEASVLAALAIYREAGCDGLVALGGGSPMDLAKAVALLATHEGPLERFGASVRGAKFIGKVAPIVAIPTTSGTGSEVSVGAVVILENGRKETIVSPHLIPPVALCDPDLTVGLPSLLTAATGMDAVTHCIEAILAPSVNPPLEAIGYDGVERAVANGWLYRAVADGADRDARWQMMMASLEGALAFAKGLGAVHALSHASGRLPGLRLHHGTLNAMFLPGVLRFSEGSAPEKYTRLKRCFGIAASADLADAVTDLNAKLGIPNSLSALGVTGDMVQDIVKYALTDLAHLTAVKKPDADQYAALVEELL
jgi:4-hydroxybutyrate dehydrogenase